MGSTTNYPTTLADLHLETTTTNSIYKNIKALKKSTLSISNRLTSILTDANFVVKVSECYDLPLVANERCGSWYIPPQRKTGSAYFKSTDGHHGQWDFSLRRLNLQLLPLIGRHGGVVLVDSTRRGKNMPDAFSKTVPIWVAVINRCLFPDASAEVLDLQCPSEPDRLGESEIVQIQRRLDGFVRAFEGLGLDLAGLREQLKYPISIEWVLNDASGLIETLDAAKDQVWLSSRRYNKIVLCSASRRVRGAEMSEAGYIQGAGDDSEGWSNGLTPQLFWKYKQQISDSSEEDLVGLIESLQRQERVSSQDLREATYTMIHPTTNLYVGVGPYLTSPPVASSDQVSNHNRFDIIINCIDPDSNPGIFSIPAQKNSLSASQKVPNTLNIPCHQGKQGSKDLRTQLPQIMSFIRRSIAIHQNNQPSPSSSTRDPTPKILVTCPTGRDHSIGIALTISCLRYSETGIFQPKTCPTNDSIHRHHAEIEQKRPNDENTQDQPNNPALLGAIIQPPTHDTSSPTPDRHAQTIDKIQIKKRLAWITGSKPDANPSRATLQAVNTYLIGRPT